MAILKFENVKTVPIAFNAIQIGKDGTKGDEGDTGATGNGIASIELTSTSGLVDTYTVTFTDGNTTTFTVTNGATGATGATGNGISSIAKTGTSGLVDTYTITFTNGTTTTFTVTNGEDGTDGNVNIASAYNSSSTYKVGDLVIYGTGLYECTVAITSPEEWNAAHWTQTNAADVLADKADIDGYYEEMSVGNAEQLISSVGINDKTPYNFRTAGGSNDIGDRKNEKIVGGTVAWNQLVQNGNFMDSTLGWIPENSQASVSASDGVLTVTAIQTPTVFYDLGIKNNQMTPLVGHKYLFHAEVNSPVGNMTFGMRSTAFYNALMVEILTSVADQWTSGYKIIDCNGTGAEATPYFAPRGITGFENGSVIKWRNIFIIDLTRMFGSIIADYIYSLEQANEGTGVAWFRKLFPKDYYPYNEGELMSVKTSKAVMTGFNAYNHTSGVAEVLAGLPYQITGTYTALSLEGESVTPDANGLFTPSKTGTLTVTGGNSNSTCVHLVWDGERNGEYEEYTTYEYPLDSSLELRGILKLDANNKLYYDGDTYESDGTVTRRYGIVDLGTCNWNADANRPGVFYTNYIRTTAKAFGTIFAVPYSWRNTGVPPAASLANYDKVISLYSSYGSGYVYIVDTEKASMTATEFKTAMNGILAVYEFATPTTDSADTYTDPMIVNDWGTEEFVDTRTVAIPVGHDTFYLTNLRAKLEMAPNSPDGDGDYIVRQSDGVNEYVPIASNPIIGGLVDRIPTGGTTGQVLAKASGTNYDTEWITPLTKYEAEITLAAADWGSNTYVATVTGMTSTAPVWASPKTRADAQIWVAAEVFNTEQGSGTLTFTCETTPTGNIDVNVVWLI